MVHSPRMELSQACIILQNMIVTMSRGGVEGRGDGELDEEIDEAGNRVNVVQEPLLLCEMMSNSL